MYQVFYNILYLSIIGSILGIIVLILRKTFDKKISPTWKFAMWLLVLVSLLVPFRFTIQSRNSHEFIISSGIDKIELAKDNLIANQSGKVFIYIWLAVMCIIFLYYIVTSIVMKKMIGKEEVKDEGILNIFDDCKKQMGIEKNIKLIKQNYKKVPCIYGLFSTKILVTDEVLEKDKQSLNYIFMHELAHFKRHDLLLNKLLIVITAIHWFNPILWYCFKQVRQDMELKADEMVLNNIQKDEEKDYAKTLVRLLPISQEEKEPVKLLCVTDGKKNMERRIKMIKLSDKFKEYKTLIGITTLLIVLCVGTFIFTRIKPQEEVVTNSVRYFEMPDRIVYKEKGRDNYYVFTKESKDYTDILNELIKGFDSKGEGPFVSVEEISNIEQNENYIELDYDTISKNYVIAYEEKTNNVILRTDNGGQVVKQNLSDKETLGKMMQEKKNGNGVNCYHMQDSKEYKVKNEVSKELFNTYLDGSYFREYEDGIYGGKIENKENLNSILQTYDIELEEELPDDIFEKADIIIMLSKYDIEKIETRIGGLTYYFTGEGREDSYIVNIFAASKAINTNCVYRNLDNITYNSNIITNSTQNSISTNNTNSSSANISNKKVDTTIRITKEQASDIADEEAKKDKYKHGEGSFTSKVYQDNSGTPEILAELIYDTNIGSNVYYWEDKWAVKDSNGNNLYQGQPVWYVRLDHEFDPLYSLYIYVDATNGNVVGAGESSD